MDLSHIYLAVHTLIHASQSVRYSASPHQHGLRMRRPRMIKMEYNDVILLGNIVQELFYIHQMPIGKRLMPCPFTGPKMFCAGPNFLSQPKI